MKKHILFCLLAFPIVATAQLPVDSTFGENGFVYFDIPTVGFARPYLRQQTDGKIIVSGGRVVAADHESYVLRLETNGTLDHSYGENGYYFFPDLTLDTNGPDIYLLPDNSLISFSSNYGASLVKLTPQGMPDPDFVVDAGYSSFDSNALSFIDQQRAFVYFPAPSVPYSAVQRIHTSTGLLDTTYGNTPPVLNIGFEWPFYGEVCLQADGKMTMSRTIYAPLPQGRQTYVTRLLPDGTTDTNFGVNGRSPLYGYPEATNEDMDAMKESLVYDETGSLYLAATNWETLHSTLYKFDASGQPVPSFGNNGKLVLPLDQFILDVYIHDGNLYLLGKQIITPNQFNDSNLLLAKYHLDGTPVSGFGTNGTYVETSNPYLESGEDLAFTPDGGLLISGETNEPGLHRPFVAKYIDNTLQTPSYTQTALYYQNPIADVLTLDGTAIAHITLYGIDGKKAGFGYGNTISTASLASGLYLATVVLQNGDTQMLKIVKR